MTQNVCAWKGFRQGIKVNYTNMTGVWFLLRNSSVIATRQMFNKSKSPTTTVTCGIKLVMESTRKVQLLWYFKLDDNDPRQLQWRTFRVAPTFKHVNPSHHPLQQWVSKNKTWIHLWLLTSLNKQMTQQRGLPCKNMSYLVTLSE